MPKARDSKCWIPFFASKEFCQSLLLADCAPLDGSPPLLTPESVHYKAVLLSAEFLSTRALIWGEKETDDDFYRLTLAVARECASYSATYTLASLTYYVVAALQFELALSLNPVYLIDSVLRVGRAERQALLFYKVLLALTDQYTKLFGEAVADSSNLVGNAHKLMESLERQSMSGLFNPLSKESIPFERLRERCGGNVTIVGGALLWQVRDKDSKIVAEGDDAGSTILSALTQTAKNEDS